MIVPGRQKVLNPDDAVAARAILDHDRLLPRC
jgi:hypothetical protein